MKTNTIITPTIGRKVWFWPNGVHLGMPEDAQPSQFDTAQALDATIVCVYGDRMVNLHVIDQGGCSYSIRSVTLKQDGDDTPTTHYCEWMPYQTKQAEKEAVSAIAAPEPEDDGTKVTMAGILDKIIDETFTLLPDGRTTICQLTLENGFTVNGTSACVDIDNYNKDLGEQYAHEDALKNIWLLEGYLLAQELYDSEFEVPLPWVIARVCHEVIRAYCQALGDMSQPEWDHAPTWQVSSAIKGVLLHLSGDHGPEASHASWMAEKVADGWVYGEVKDPVAKTHPCIVPFAELSVQQQAKDFIFRAIVHAMKPEGLEVISFEFSEPEPEVTAG